MLIRRPLRQKNNNGLPKSETAALYLFLFPLWISQPRGWKSRIPALCGLSKGTSWKEWNGGSHICFAGSLSFGSIKATKGYQWFLRHQTTKYLYRHFLSFFSGQIYSGTGIPVHIYIFSHGVPQSPVLWAEALEHAHSSVLEYTPPSGHRLRQPKKPWYVEDFKIQPPNTVNRITTLSPYPNGPILQKCCLAPCSLKKEKTLSLSPTIVLHFKTTLGVNVIPSTFGQPLRHKNLPTQWKGKLQREATFFLRISSQNYIPKSKFVHLGELHVVENISFLNCLDTTT